MSFEYCFLCEAQINPETAKQHQENHDAMKEKSMFYNLRSKWREQEMWVYCDDCEWILISNNLTQTYHWLCGNMDSVEEPVTRQQWSEITPELIKHRLDQSNSRKWFQNKVKKWLLDKDGNLRDEREILATIHKMSDNQEILDASFGLIGAILGLFLLTWLSYLVVG